MNPYAEKISARAGLATSRGRYRFDAMGEFRNWFPGIRTIIQVHASQLDFTNFFGLGNETGYDQSRDDAGYYKVDQQQVMILAGFDIPIAAGLSITAGGSVKLVDNNPQANTLLSTLPLPFNRNTLTWMNGSLKAVYDTRKGNPTADGFLCSTEIIHSPSLIDLKTDFTRLRFETRVYRDLSRSSLVLLALRFQGEKIWGDHPFFESSFLGGTESLRGFERQRFAGDASCLGSTELRARVAKIPFLVPLWIGVSGFIETGRVFLAGEGSSRWHNVIGGGLWFSFIKPEYIANFSLARSEDKFAFYTTMGFMF
jgi:outer membrane protein assembly factor BamA